MSEWVGRRLTLSCPSSAKGEKARNSRWSDGSCGSGERGRSVRLTLTTRGPAKGRNRVITLSCGPRKSSLDSDLGYQAKWDVCKIGVTSRPRSQIQDFYRWRNRGKERQGIAFMECGIPCRPSCRLSYYLISALKVRHGTARAVIARAAA